VYLRNLWFLVHTTMANSLSGGEIVAVWWIWVDQDLDMKYVVFICGILYCTVLYCTVLYCTVLYCTCMCCWVCTTWCCDTNTSYLFSFKCCWENIIGSFLVAEKIYSIYCIIFSSPGLSIYLCTTVLHSEGEPISYLKRCLQYLYMFLIECLLPWKCKPYSFNQT
jgi:hypothetical protein